jgi:DNA helicase-4
LLGRYRADEEFLSGSWKRDFGSRIQLSFMTIHGSKGLEADYVILPRMTSGRYGFPSTIEDDPVLQLAMPKADDFPFAEERRLFYVALTRARRGVLMFTVRGKQSDFLREIVNAHGLKVVSTDGSPVEIHTCPKCGQGEMVPRSGKHGRFWACNRFPACKSSANTLLNSMGQMVAP